MGFRFLLFDGLKVVNTLPKSMQKAFLTPFFPLVYSNSRISKSRKSEQRLIVSVVGDLRSEKGDVNEIGDLLGKLVDLQRWEIRCGVRETKVSPLKHIKGLNFFHTGSRMQYMQFLSESDVILIFANKKQYFYRHSGTIMDAVSCGAIPLVPNFPVLASQVREPVPVGEVYNSILSIPDILIKLELSLPMLVDNRNCYKDERAFVEFEAYYD
jgi:hypothetical protein